MRAEAEIRAAVDELEAALARMSPGPCREVVAFTLSGLLWAAGKGPAAEAVDQMLRGLRDNRLRRDAVPNN